MPEFGADGAWSRLAKIYQKQQSIFEDLELRNFVKKGDILIKLKSGNILAPFNGVLGYTGLTEDILVSNNIIKAIRIVFI